MDLLKVLLVDDEGLIRRFICDLMQSWDAEVLEARTCKEGLLLLKEDPDLLILDIFLPDGSGLDIAEKAALKSPSPLCVAVSGKASAEEAFKLSEYGVVDFLTKPFSPQTFRQVIGRALSQVPEISPHLKPLVGRDSLRHVQLEVRKTMLVQALALTHGNITRSAELLGVTRQAVQHMIKELEIDLGSFTLPPNGD